MGQPITTANGHEGKRLFSEKAVYIVSHEKWGKMLLSKHHYAIELAKLGNRVYFVNHPDKQKRLGRGEIKITPSEVENVFVIESRLTFPYFFKFRFPRLYQWLISFHIKRMLASAGRQPDIVWSFDSGNTFPLKSFPGNAIKILMPVDGPFGHKSEIESANTADVIISVTDDILKVYERNNTPKLKVSHGVADVFLRHECDAVENTPTRIGYSGSLLRADIDYDTLTRLVALHRDKIFEFWGEYDIHGSNIHLPQDIASHTKSFIEKLRAAENVKLHGPVSPHDLALGLKNMDVLLICYQHDCQNSHKILEYLGAGKVVITSRVSQYAEQGDLLEMVANDNSEYLSLFAKVVSNLKEYNRVARCEKRIQFARQYSYRNNIKRIEEFINRVVQ